jgi:beta-glucosidase
LKTKHFIFWLFLLLFFSSGAQEIYPFQDSKLSVEQRVNDLIGRLTLHEKVSLMLYNSPAIDRLNIPAYNWWNEALHGVGRAGKATVFPQSIGLAATFDPDLVYRVATAISDEARAKHNEAVKKENRQQYTGLTFWSPNINIFRDPRWGRGQETYGEDPFLTSQMGVAFVRGMQGDNPDYLKTSACAKHFAVHSGPEESRHRFNTVPDETDLQETYLPAFKALVENGVSSVMCAYNRLYDEPCCGNKFLLDTLLRQEWGFDGYIVTDCWALDDIWLRHKVTDDKVKAAVMAAQAGVNLNCGYLFKFLPEAVDRGMISEKQIDEILKPALRTRFKLGLMGEDKNDPYAAIPVETVNSEKHRKLAYEAVVKSIVLLKNKNNVLPLDKEKLHKLYVTGPTADDNMVLLGNYNGFSGNLVTILEGIINKVDAGTVVDFNQGTLLNGMENFNGTWQARSSDATIACIGNSRFLEGENGDAFLNENGGDRTSLRLPENQIKFIKKLRKEAGDKLLIVVITGGSAVAIPEIAQLADAILFVWYPGEQGGNAVADVLFGDYNPAGRLPVTFYKGVEDLPPFDDYDMANRTYRYFKGKPQYEFGYGLSYTQFDYSGLKVKQEKDTLIVTFMLDNTGKKAGDEVVQLYVKEESLRQKVPLKSLKGFRRLFLEAGKRKSVRFSIPLEELKYWNSSENRFVSEKTFYEIQVGASSEDIRLKQRVKIHGQI